MSRRVPSRTRNKAAEYKQTYLRVRKHINKLVIYSLKYEQLKTPEVRRQLMVPLAENIIESSRGVAGETPQFTPAYGATRPDETGLPLCLVHVLLLLRREWLVQLEHNLVVYDLLVTKATVCEILAGRMLREYSLSGRISLLFQNPREIGYSTVELAILTKAKRFLAQPVVIHILLRVYSGELIVKETDWEGRLDEPDVVRYRYRTSMHKAVVRLFVVPKYQNLIVNVKYAVLTAFFLVLVLRHKSQGLGENRLFAAGFWVLALSFNLDFIQKLLHVEFCFLRKLVWTYLDFCIVGLIDVAFVLRLLYGAGKLPLGPYYDLFSVIPVLLFPRMLSVFNNYAFFNMMVLLFRRMLVYMVAMFLLFVLLIFGFFLCFITLTIDMTVMEVAFAMLKLFFGFTPAVWDNWSRFNPLGRGVLLAYLFLVQFIVATILAIVLSNVFTEVSESNNREFEYMKTLNLVVYLRWAAVRHKTTPFSVVVSVFKLPIVLVIYAYERVVKDHVQRNFSRQEQLKHFTFFEDDDDVSTLKSRRGSHFGPLPVPVRNVSSATHHTFLDERRLLPKQSTNTLGLQSMSVDLIFMDDFLGRRYGQKVRAADVMKKLEAVEQMLRSPNEAQEFP